MWAESLDWRWVLMTTLLNRFPQGAGSPIRSVLRRRADKKVHPQNWANPRNLSIDTNKRQVYKGLERIRLTGMEFSLLELLVSRSGEAFSRSEILQEVWDTHQMARRYRVVDVHISRLSKAGRGSEPSELIMTAARAHLFQRIIELGRM